jgi:hypothetical protein
MTYINYFCHCIISIRVLDKVNYVLRHFMQQFPLLVLAYSARHQLFYYAEAIGILS